MKKIICASVIMLPILLSGCSTNTQNASVKNAKSETASQVKKPDTIPEPLTDALNALKNDDLGHTSQYLDLTVSDFKTSPYEIDAIVLKNLIIWSEMQANFDMADYLEKGVNQRSARVLYNNSDINNLKSYGASSESTVGGDLKTITSGISDSYSSYKSNAINDPIKVDYQPYVNIPSSLSFFSSVGYPIPSQTDINDFLANDQKQRLEGIIDTVFKDGKISYPDYFWSMSGLFKEDDPMLKQLLLEIVDLTKDDKYNQTRLDAENELKKIGVNVPDANSSNDKTGSISSVSTN